MLVLNIPLIPRSKGNERITLSSTGLLKLEKEHDRECRPFLCLCYLIETQDAFDVRGDAVSVERDEYQLSDDEGLPIG